ncbi:cubilin-like [Ostrea edulis]|uniref:cubilin-like n=1 Tax=Ostrea edulis TaxID=37623 RepID=UPI0024AEFAAE|nr:cubilin-like [Ostrea edulis]
MQTWWCNTIDNSGEPIEIRSLKNENCNDPLFIGLDGVIQAFTETPLTCTGATTTISINELYGVYSYFPNGPSGSYPTSMSCKWVFETADPNLKITFEVIDIYVHCSDTLKVYDGRTSTSTLLAYACCVAYCGGSSSKTTPTGNSFNVQFTTDGTTNADESGFKIVVIYGKEESPCVLPNSHVQLTLTTETTVTSPQFPTPAEGQDICSYTFTYPNGKVKFQIEYLDMEPYLPPRLVCPHKVELFDGPSTASTSLYKVCSAPPVMSFTSSGPSMTIKFHSDYVQMIGVGFVAKLIPVIAAPKIPETTTSSTRKHPRSYICRPKRPLTAIQGKADKRTQKVIQP